MSCLTRPRPRPLRKHSPGAWGDRHGQAGGAGGVHYCLQPGVHSLDGVPVQSLQVHHHNGQSLYSHRRVGMTGGGGGGGAGSYKSDDNYFSVKDKQ